MRGAAGTAPAPRPGDLVTVELTHAAPHHLLADSALAGGTYAVRRTRAGDVWDDVQAGDHAHAGGGLRGLVRHGRWRRRWRPRGPGHARLAARATPALRTVSGDVPAAISIVGATATGKSAVALAVAERLGGEIVNADSMQFYRGMDIGTAKLPVGERRGIPHHQLDTLDVHEDASVARFQESARADIDAIHARGRRAIVVGGSGLYVRALLDRFEFPGTDPAVRARLEARAQAEGPGILHRELAARDPEAASRIQPQNAKRIVRALEVIELTGELYSSSLPDPHVRDPCRAGGSAARLRRARSAHRCSRHAHVGTGPRG